MQPHLKNVKSTSAIVCWQQTEMSFLFFNPIKKGWNSSAPPLGLPRDSHPLPHSLYGRMDGRTFIRTVTSLPNFLGLMGYQFFLPMVLRWRASRVEAPLLHNELTAIGSKAIFMWSAAWSFMREEDCRTPLIFSCAKLSACDVTFNQAFFLRKGEGEGREFMSRSERRFPVRCDACSWQEICGTYDDQFSLVRLKIWQVFWE